MEKSGVVAALGQAKLLLPVQVKAALLANDRLKFALTILQSASAHANAPTMPALDLTRDYAAARFDAPWLLEVPASGWYEGKSLHLPELAKLAALLRENLEAMALPLQGSSDPGHRTQCERTAAWCEWLAGLDRDAISPEQMHSLTAGKRGGEDTVHILVMDLHKSLNRLAADLSDEAIDGAHVWQIAESDRPLIAAFMRGLNRTKALKFGHRGLDTAATRDGDRLLIQNDIGTNDAHVLVVQVEGPVISLTYSDLHERRFTFFQHLLEEIGAVWSGIAARATAGLNDDENYFVGSARFECATEDARPKTLEALGRRIVFLIDWNRARKRLVRLVAKPLAVAVLAEAARREVGHMGWLLAGGDRLVFSAMEALGPGHFRMGDQLDEVLGTAEAQEFLVGTLSLATEGLRTRQTAEQIGDQTRLLLARHLTRHQSEFDAVCEHAAHCHALAEALRDALAHGHERDEGAAVQLASRAKGWERKADQLVMHVRERSERNPGWMPFLKLVERADDAADALEEAAFILSLLAQGSARAWDKDLREAVRLLSATVLETAQDHVRALAIARTLTMSSSADDQEEFLAVCWRVVNAERHCDNLLREVQRRLVRGGLDAAGMMLSKDFAAALEASTDAFLHASYAMRDLAFARLGAAQGGV
jgi:uncharacterized protein Yka (UPF0111/DUF47 family)